MENFQFLLSEAMTDYLRIVFVSENKYNKKEKEISNALKLDFDIGLEICFDIPETVLQFILAIFSNENKNQSKIKNK